MIWGWRSTPCAPQHEYAQPNPCFNAMHGKSYEDCHFVAATLLILPRFFHLINSTFPSFWCYTSETILWPWVTMAGHNGSGKINLQVEHLMAQLLQRRPMMAHCVARST